MGIESKTVNAGISAHQISTTFGRHYYYIEKKSRVKVQFPMVLHNNKDDYIEK